MNVNTTVRMLRVVESSEVPVLRVPEPGHSPSGRVFALLLLALTVGGIAWVATTAYRIATDAWIAPLHLSRDSDAVAQLRVAQQRNQGELAQLDAEVTRLDGELSAIDLGIAKLAALRDSAAHTLLWQADQSRVEASGIDQQTALMRKELASLTDLHARQEQVVAKAQTDLAAGLVERAVVDREEQTRDGFVVQITELERQISETTLRSTQTRTLLHAYDTHATGMPEVAAGDEHTARIDVEISRLESEARGDRALRTVAHNAAAAQRELLVELEAKPLYRAMTATTDIAFVPYTQLDKLTPGATILACTWSVFNCHDVGTVTEIVPGEVVTQDPWGEIARGQYAVLSLDDKAAIRERVLRVR